MSRNLIQTARTCKWYEIYLGTCKCPDFALSPYNYCCDAEECPHWEVVKKDD